MVEATRTWRDLSRRFPFGASLVAHDPRHMRSLSKLLTKRFISGSFFKLTHCRILTDRTKKEQCSSYVPGGADLRFPTGQIRLIWRSAMLRLFVEEAAALTSIALFVGMIAIWAQVIPQL